MPLSHITNMIRNILQILRGTIAWIKANYRYHQTLAQKKSRYKNQLNTGFRPKSHFCNRYHKREYHGV